MQLVRRNEVLHEFADKNGLGEFITPELLANDKLSLGSAKAALQDLAVQARAKARIEAEAKAKLEAEKAESKQE